MNPEKELRRPEAGEIASVKRDIEYLSSVFTILPNPDPILKKLGKDISAYEDVRSDAHVYSVLTSRKAGVVSCPWRVEPASDKRADRKVAEFVARVLESLNFYEDLKQLLEAVWFGYSVAEIMWVSREGRWHIGDIKARSPRRFAFDPEGNLRLLTPENPVDGEPVPPAKFLVVRHDPASEDNPYGEPVAARCYWPWFFKKHGLKFWAVFVEKFGMPHVWGKHPPGASENEKQALLEALVSLVQDGATVTADNQAIELLDDASRTGSTDTYRALVEAANQEISKAVLGQTLSTEVGDRGSYAAAKAHMDVRADIVEADARMLMAALNDQLVRWLVGFNFGWDVPLPRFTIDYEEEDYKKDKAERDKILFDMGYPFPVKYLSETYGVPLPQEEEETLRKSEVPAPAFSEKSPGRQRAVARQNLLDRLFINALAKARPVYLRILASIEKEVRSWKRPDDSAGLVHALDEEAANALADLLVNTSITAWLFGRKELYDQLRQTLRFQELEPVPMIPKEALDHFRELIPVPAEEFYALEDDLRASFFTVSRVESLELVAQIQGKLAQALEQGKTLAEFQEELDDVFGAAGVSGDSPYHIETIFRTNIQTAYYAGYRGALSDPGMSHEFPYLEYITAGDDRVRPAHQAMDGHIAPVNDPVWNQWFPPNGFNCRCDVVAVSREEAVDRGLTVGPPPPVRPDQGFETDPRDAIRRLPGNRDFQEPSEADPLNPSLPGICGAEFSLWGWFKRLLPGDYRTKCRPPVARIPRSDRVPAPTLLPGGKDTGFYIDFLAREFGSRKATIRCKPLGLVFPYTLDAEFLVKHLAKDPERLRFLPLLKPTLEEPYEVWFRVERLRSGHFAFRLRHIGLFVDQKNRNYLVVLDINRRGILAWTAFPVRDPVYLDGYRKGSLIYVQE